MVTGGAGFIGSHVTDLLVANGNEVLVIDDLTNSTTEWLTPGAEFVQHDVASELAARSLITYRPDVVVHLAAQMSVSVSMQDPLEDARVNVLGLLNIAESAKLSGCRRIVFATSGGTIYGDAEEQPTTEFSRKDGARSFYGATKALGVTYLEIYRRQFGMISSSLALGNVFGPRQLPGGPSGVIAKFCWSVLSGKPCVINGDGETRRDYVFVTDVAEAFVTATSNGQGLINIGTGTGTSVNQVLEMVTRVAGRGDVPVIHGPALPGEVRQVSLDPRRAREILGWQAGTTLQSGIDATAQWLTNLKDARGE